MGSAENLLEAERLFLDGTTIEKHKSHFRVQVALFLTCTIPPGVPLKPVDTYVDLSPKGPYD